MCKILIETLTEDMKKILSKKRLSHAINVKNTAIELAQYYGINESKAAIAGVLHDCAKALKPDVLIDKCEKYNIAPDPIMIRQTELLHAPVGAHIARDIYGIIDEEIFNAIFYHTTGRKCMSPLEKIIYISDSIEPGREFVGVEVARNLAYQNIDKCFVFCADSAIQYITKKGGLIHPNTVEARNDALIRLLF